MFDLIEGPKVVPASRKLAEHFRDLPACPRDRPYSEYRASFLSEQVKAKKFRTCEWASAYCQEDKKEYRVNGKHTATLFSGTDVSLDGISIVVSKFKCKDLESVASLYATFDNKASARNFRDINLVFAGAMPNLAVVSPTTIHTCVSGLAYDKWEDNMRKGGTMAEARAHLLLEAEPFVLWVQSMLSGEEVRKNNRDLLRRAGVCAAMHRTWKKNRKAAEEFWVMVRDASHASNKHPSRTLHEFLLTTRVHIGAGSRSTLKQVSNKEMMVRSLLAWNAYRRGEPLERLKFHPDKRIPAAA